MTQRTTCQFEMQLTEKNGEVYIEFRATPLYGSQCLHRDVLKATALEAETDEYILSRDNIFFKNIEALESTLTVATF